MALNNTLILHIGIILVFGTWYYFVCRTQKKDGDGPLQALSSSLSVFFSDFRLPVAVFLSGIGCQIFFSSALSLLHRIIPSAFAAYDKLVEQVNSDQTPLILILCVCLLAPVGEELLFRGVLLYYAKLAIPAGAAVLLQGILFGIYHGNLIQGIYAALMGILFGAIAHRRRSVIPCIALHTVINVCLYLVPQTLYASALSAASLFIVSGIMLIPSLRPVLRERP